MGGRYKNVLTDITAFVGVNVFADVPATQKDEVRHLLNHVERSRCIIECNGSRHSGKEAVTHIQKKYDYFRDRITSTEDFIEYSASKSTMSGKAYRKHCTGETQTTKEWLLKELKAC